MTPADATLNHQIAAWMRTTVARHPELAMPVERAFLERVQQVTAAIADASGSELVQLQGQCQTLAGILEGLLGEGR